MTLHLRELVFRGEKWWGETLKGILRNPVYAGCNVYGRHEKGDTRVKPREEWTVVPGMREPVVEGGVFRPSNIMNSQGREEVPADQGAADREKGFVDVGASFESDAEPAKLVQPGEGSLHHPPVDAQAAAVWRAAFGQDRFDTASAQLSAVRLAVISPVTLDRIRSTAGTTYFPFDGANAVHQSQKLGHVVRVSTRQNGGQGDTLGVGDQVVLAACFGPVGGIGAGFSPPKTARTDALSTTVRDQSMASAFRSLARRTWWSFCQTPASSHFFKYRQQVIPLPQPISWGSISQGMPLLRTNRMPVSTLRRSMGLRPG